MLKEQNDDRLEDRDKYYGDIAKAKADAESGKNKDRDQGVPEGRMRRERGDEKQSQGGATEQLGRKGKKADESAISMH